MILPPKKSLFQWSKSNRPRVLSSHMDDHRPGKHGNCDVLGLGDALDRRSQDPHAATWGHGFGLGYPTDPDTIHRWQLLIRKHLRGDHEGGGDLLNADLRFAKELPRQLVWTADGIAHLAWPQILHSFLRPRRIVHPSYLRPNRRFPDRIGELPGRTRSAPKPVLLIGIDTSASMTADILGRIDQEIQVLSRYSKITIAECDAAVQRIYPLRSIDQVLGGGDTDFHPLFGLGDTARRSFDGILYFTDGKGAWPEAMPSLPVLWVLTNDQAFDCPWGTVVRLPGV
jgi:hypothetical protein